MCCYFHGLAYQLTHPFGDDDSRSAGQGIHRLLWATIFIFVFLKHIWMLFYHVYQCTFLLGPNNSILSWMNSLCIRMYTWTGRKCYVGSVVLTTMTTKGTVFWVAEQCSLETAQWFGGTPAASESKRNRSKKVAEAGGKLSLTFPLTVNTEAIRSSETLASLQTTRIWRFNLQERTLHKQLWHGARKPE
jgi:hypothetical protein